MGGETDTRTAYISASTRDMEGSVALPHYNGWRFSPLGEGGEEPGIYRPNGKFFMPAQSMKGLRGVDEFVSAAFDRTGNIGTGKIAELRGIFRDCLVMVDWIRKY